VIDWNATVREHSAALFRVAWRILGQAEDAEDVVQEVFAEAHRLANGRQIGCWAALLRRMATCRALDKLRRRRMVMPLEDDLLAAAQETPEAVAASRELELRLRTALKELSPREAEVFCLRYFEDFSYREIAETLGISLTAASTALAKSRSRLEVLLAVQNSGGPS
jgi:RNA polymerase sigma-70 factor (ECF subfamily)